MRRRQALHLLAGPVPRTKITGGKAMSGKTRRCFGRAAQALRLAAATAAAHGLVRMGCTLPTRREEHADPGHDRCEESCRERERVRVRRASGAAPTR